MKYIDIADYNAVSVTPAARVTTIKNGEEIIEVLDKSVDTIVIHHWGNDGQKFEQVCSFLQSSPVSSAHFVVESGRCAQLVDIKNVAWHSGNWDANMRSIGIECRPEMSPEDFETVAQVIADLEVYYGRSFYISGHLDHYNTECPGRWYDQLDRLVDRVNAIKEGKIEHGIEGVPAPLEKDKVSELRESWAKLKDAVTEFEEKIDNA
ncbi:peptidoglycan recognition family protein [uncultured Rothia sp.]|uniref:peptidoglycan recognition protein family protein n=1 Tax=uncultured Rothia sp. TaxID=316088 RepID=UPI0028897845|nr:peptidoglycan recognition family protein [uncultured Rothia sp.]